MKMRFDNQLSLKFPPPERKHKPVGYEMVRDSLGRSATTKEDEDELLRAKTENLVLRTNMRVFLDKKDREIAKLKKEIKQLKYDISH